ncbi:glycosyltransferase [Butyrivibrio fibrisolvens]|uniref:glycosyltransferase n=1 Tax=Butyrivibrio fibrisolvens TaxID=831 RepID=UPI00040C6721|nr:glycosyltransferase [Butyrivibrio fibrisolvens]
MKKILFITCNNIYDSNGNGGIKGSQKNLELLKKAKNVKVIIFSIQPNEKPLPPPDANFIMQPKTNIGMLIANLLGYRRCFPWQLLSLKELLDSEKPELVFIDGSLLGNILKQIKNAKTIVFFHNVEADYTMNKVRSTGLSFLPAYLSTVKNEKFAIGADLIGCLNQRDSNRIQTLYGRKADFLLPVTFNDVFDSAKAKPNPTNRLLFVGSLFTPNQVSIEWFMKNIMTKLPQFHLDIVGKGFERKKNAYESLYPNVSVQGYTDRIDECYYSHAVVVMPIIIGAGMKIKTAEAMMYGRTIIATDEALEGYDVDDVDGIYRCNSAEEYINTITMLSRVELPPFQKDVRTRFLDKYENKKLLKTLEEIL